MQHLLTEAVVDWSEIADQLSLETNALLGGQESVLIFAESPFAKKGEALHKCCASVGRALVEGRQRKGSVCLLHCAEAKIVIRSKRFKDSRDRFVFAVGVGRNDEPVNLDPCILTAWLSRK